MTFIVFIWILKTNLIEFLIVRYTGNGLVIELNGNI